MTTPIASFSGFSAGAGRWREFKVTVHFPSEIGNGSLVKAERRQIEMAQDWKALVILPRYKEAGWKGQA
jgi:hypothetical protein